jgi:DNA repair protein RecO (recombination protein O)
VEPDGVPPGLAGDAVLSGFYLNEVLMRLLPRHDPHSELYASYIQTLELLRDSQDNEWALRLFERDLLQELGYGLQLTHESAAGEPLAPDLRYCYHPEYGPQRLHNDSADCLAVQGETLLALNSGESAGEQCRREAKRLMRAILQPYLGNRPLASRELFKARYSRAKQTKPNTDNEE